MDEKGVKKLIAEHEIRKKLEQLESENKALKSLERKNKEYELKQIEKNAKKAEIKQKKSSSYGFGLFPRPFRERMDTGTKKAGQLRRMLDELDDEGR